MTSRLGCCIRVRWGPPRAVPGRGRARGALDRSGAQPRHPGAGRGSGAESGGDRGYRSSFGRRVFGLPTACCPGRGAGSGRGRVRRTVRGRQRGVAGAGAGGRGGGPGGRRGVRGRRDHRDAAGGARVHQCYLSGARAEEVRDLFGGTDVDARVITGPLGVKAVGEIGQVGSAAAIANAVYHATGYRAGELPIAVEHLLAHLPSGPVAAAAGAQPDRTSPAGRPAARGQPASSAAEGGSRCPPGRCLPTPPHCSTRRSPACSASTSPRSPARDRGSAARRGRLLRPRPRHRQHRNSAADPRPDLDIRAASRRDGRVLAERLARVTTHHTLGRPSRHRPGRRRLGRADHRGPDHRRTVRHPQCSRPAPFPALRRRFPRRWPWSARRSPPCSSCRWSASAGRSATSGGCGPASPRSRSSGRPGPAPTSCSSTSTPYQPPNVPPLGCATWAAPSPDPASARR